MKATMSDVITDEQVVTVLRPFVRATAPVLDAVREADPLTLRLRAAELDGRPSRRLRVLRRLARLRAPGTPQWARMDPDQRVRWWIHRLGRVTSALTAVPGIGGALTDRLPVTDALGAASQGLLLTAIAAEHGVTDQAERVQLLAWVLFGRTVDAELAAGRHPGHDVDVEKQQVTELTEKLRGRGRRVSVKGLAVTLWRLGRSLLAIAAELEKRPRGRWWHRLLGKVPGVGMLADYLGERSALIRVAARAYRRLGLV